MRLSELAAKSPVKILSISSGERGIDQTVDQMERVMLASLGNQEIRMRAEQIVSMVAPNDRMGEAEAVYQFVRDYVRYTKDPAGMEYVQTPQHILKMIDERGQAYGDCDDKTVLGLSLLKNLGFEVAIRVASYRASGQFTHVYGLVKIKGEWVVFDATPTHQSLGWEAEATRVKDREVKPYGWEMGGLHGFVAGDINLGQIATLMIAIAGGAWLSSHLNGK
jgi:predicted transglutaminase-like cysteine proteinase